MILCISVLSVVISPFLFLILLIWFFSLCFLMSLANGLSILFIFSKNWLLALLIFAKHVYYLGWNRSPALVGCMRQVLGPGALGRPRGIGQRGRWEGGSGWGTHVYPWLIHVSVWQKPLQYCKVISLQLIKKLKLKLKKKKIWMLKIIPYMKPQNTFK